MKPIDTDFWFSLPLCRGGTLFVNTREINSMVSRDDIHCTHVILKSGSQLDVKMSKDEIERIFEVER